MEHTYDFYKPTDSEYPTVDGKLSNSCYLRALDHCYSRYSKKFEQFTGKNFVLPDYLAFHTPYVKLVQKAMARLVSSFFFLFIYFIYFYFILFYCLFFPIKILIFFFFFFFFFFSSHTFSFLKTYLDFIKNPDDQKFESPEIQQFRNLLPEDTYFNVELEKCFRKLSDPIFESKVLPSTIVPTNVGNTYCGSLYSSLISLLSNVPSDQLV